MTVAGTNLRALSYEDGVLAGGCEGNQVFLYTYNSGTGLFEEEQVIWLTGSNIGSV